MANTTNMYIICVPQYPKLSIYIRFNKVTKYIIKSGIISNKGSELLYDIVVFKDQKKDRLLIFVIVARYLLKGKEGLLLFLVICSKVYHNS